MPQPSWSPSTTQQLRKLVAAPYLAPNDWTPRSEAYFVFPLAQGTPGKQCGLAATGVYQPSLRSPWLAAKDFSKIPGSPLTYWVGDCWFQVFSDSVPIGEVSYASEGIKTGNNEKYLRHWFEVAYLVSIHKPSVLRIPTT
ncbi:hypothetical protein [Thiolapillus sp.]|uniref:hypothetical protein n=2 Tax=Thiolapillus sp. TaxID=2017437 RepID=UPI003AF5945A